MSRRTKSLGAVLAIAVVFGGGALAFSRTLAGAAVFASRDQFIRSGADPRVLYEPGMDAEAALVVSILPGAIAHIEKQQYLPLAKPFRIYVCNSQESFNTYMGAPPGATARGVKVLNDIFLAPVAFSSWRGDTHESVLAHELSHLHLYQRLGHRKSLWDTPVWFLEGLAVVVSGGGGEGVTPSDAEASILSGHHFTPDDCGSLLRPKRAADYGTETFMFYRQSELFVRFIRNQNTSGFENFLLALQLGGNGNFATLFEASFGTDVDGMWEKFEAHLRKSRSSAGIPRHLRGETVWEHGV